MSEKSAPDLLIGLGLAGLSFAIFVYSRHYASNGADVFPRGIAVIIGLFGLTLSIRSAYYLVTKKVRSSSKNNLEAALPEVRPEMIIAMILSIVFVGSVEWLGFTTAILTFVPLMSWVLGVRNWVLIALVSVIFTAAATWTFANLLAIRLPPDLLGSFLSLQ